MKWRREERRGGGKERRGGEKRGGNYVHIASSSYFKMGYHIKG